MADLTFSHDCIILDACCVINLYASQQMEEILTVIPPAVCIAAYVKDKEILKTYNRSTGNAEDIDLQVLIERDILLPVDLDLETEAETHVTFAAVLDDGEAITGAIAFHRKWAIAPMIEPRLIYLHMKRRIYKLSPRRNWLNIGLIKLNPHQK